MIKLILIGMGFHAQRLYLDFFRKYKQQALFDISLILDLEHKQKEIEAYLATHSLNFKTKFIAPFISDTLPNNLDTWLSQFVINHHIDGVIIATEPRVHYAYGKWALANQLHILMDKPICTFDNVAFDLKQANKILTAYEDLSHTYQTLQKSKKTIFSINTQRRYHPGFHLIKDKIDEVLELTGCPITNLVSNHSDGQFRLPNELLHMDYHGYNQGFGKISHSGYHIIDLFYCLYRSSLLSKSDLLTHMEVFSSFTLPSAFLKQVQQQGYETLFGTPAYNDYNPLPHDKIQTNTEGYGEIDANINLKVLSGNDNLCTVTLNLLHNSLSQRDHLMPKKNLYLDNGRVKHEWHQIQQGPFQNIQVHSYKTGIPEYDNNPGKVEINATTHFDINIYRNKLIAKNNATVETFNLCDLVDYEFSHKFSNTNDAKENAVFEFIHLIQEGIDIETTLSPITDHKMPCLIMTAIYQSHIHYINQKNPITPIFL